MKSFKVLSGALLVMVFLSAFFSCEIIETLFGYDGTVSLSSTADGDVVSGTVSLEGPATGDIDGVTLLLDGDLFGNAVPLAGSWSYEFDTTEFPDGEIELTVSGYHGNELLSSINVLLIIDNIPDIAVTGVSLDINSVTLTISETYQLTATVEPQDATNNSVSWESNDTDIATVSDTGLVTAEAVGTAQITVTTNDGDFNDTCTVTVEEQTTGGDINVVGQAQGSTYDFGTCLSDGNGGVTTDYHEFTIENGGDSELIINDITLTGSYSGQFDFDADWTCPYTLPAQDSINFFVRFDPALEDRNVRAASVEIQSDDEDEASYIFDVEGDGIAPEVAVAIGSIYISSGASYSFTGDCQLGQTADQIFRIDNLGDTLLNLTGTPLVEITGTNASDFSITEQPSPSISADDWTLFTIEFEPTETGDRYATVTIPNNDLTEGTYTFDISASCVDAPQPEINIKQGSTDLPDGSGSFWYMDTRGDNTRDVDFTIENTGDAALSITSVSSTLDNFSIENYPSTINDGSEGTLSISFTPSGVGSYTASITVGNDDADEGTYTFDVFADAYGINSPQEVPDNTSHDGAGISIAANPLNGNLFIAYQESGSNMHVARSENSGTNWSTVVTKSGQWYPSIAVDQSESGSQWIHFAYNTSDSLVWIRSTDGGDTWSSSAEVLDSGADPTWVDVAATTGEVEIVYNGTVSGDDPIKRVYSGSGGNTWDSAISLETGIDCRYPSVAFLDFNTRFVSAVDYQNAVWVGKTTDGGDSWNGQSVESGIYPNDSSIAASDGKVYVHYANSGTLKCAVSEDEGSTWTVHTVDTSLGSFGGSGDIAASGDTVVIAYRLYNSSSDSDLMVARSPDGGNNWTTYPVHTSDNVGTEVSVVLYNGTIHIAYSDKTNSQVLHSRISY